MSEWITVRRPLREPSESVSKQKHNTCYAHVIARCMRRVIYTFYDIPSETRIEDYYDEDNMNIDKYFEYSGMEMEDVNVAHNPGPRPEYNYEHFSALVYLYFYNLAIDINIVIFKDTNGGLNGGSVYNILFRIFKYWRKSTSFSYDNFISTLKAERYKREYLLRAVYGFISATFKDPHIRFECFKNNFFTDRSSIVKMIKKAHKKLNQLGVEFELTTPVNPVDLTLMLIKLCDYALDNGYTSFLFCQNVQADMGHVVLIVGRREPDVENPTISYKIKNSWGSQCIANVDKMHIRNSYVQIQDLYDENCGLIVVLPKKIKQPNERISNIMNDIVYGRLRIETFNQQISKLFDQEERVVQREEEERREEERRRIEEEPRSARGRSSERPSSRSPGRKSRSRSRGGSRKTHRKRHAHRKTKKSRH